MNIASAVCDADQPVAIGHFTLMPMGGISLN